MIEEKHKSVWQDCLSIIENIVEPQQFSTWFKPIRPVSLNESKLTVEVPTHFFQEWLENNFLDVLTKTLHRVLGADAKLYYKVRMLSGSGNITFPQNETAAPVNASVSIPTASLADRPGAYVIPGTQRVQINPQLNPIYNFSNLVEGACNRLGIKAGQEIAKNPGKTLNPLFLFGGSGLGKTHIAQAIGLEIKKLDPSAVVLYVQASRFKAQLMNAVQQKNQFADFISFYQRIDVLIIDDIQEFSSPGVQKAFFQIFNHLHQNGKQIVLTSDCPQVELQNFEQRLLSRLKWGLSVELTAPDYATRLAMLRMRAEREGAILSEDILEYLASHVKSNFRELEGALISVIAHATIAHEDATIDLATKVCGMIVDETQTEITVDKVQDAVCEYFKIDRDNLLSPSRKRQIVQARQIAMYLSRNLTNSSLSAIGEIIGGKDHATVLHACNTVADLMTTDRVFKQYVLDIQKSLSTVQNQ